MHKITIKHSFLLLRCKQCMDLFQTLFVSTGIVPIHSAQNRIAAALFSSTHHPLNMLKNVATYCFWQKFVPSLLFPSAASGCLHAFIVRIGGYIWFYLYLNVIFFRSFLFSLSMSHKASI